MGFIGDPEALRTYDPAANLELITCGGSNDGTWRFVVVPLGEPSNVLGGFTAEKLVRAATDDEKQQSPGLTSVAQWKVTGGWDGGYPLKGYTAAASAALIADAITAFKGLHGVRHGFEHINRYDPVILPSALAKLLTSTDATARP